MAAKYIRASQRGYKGGEQDKRASEVEVDDRGDHVTISLRARPGARCLGWARVEGRNLERLRALLSAPTQVPSVRHS